MAEMRNAIRYARRHPEFPIEMPHPESLKWISNWEDVSNEYLSVKADLSAVVQRHQRLVQLQTPVPSPAFTTTSTLAPLSSPPVEPRTRLGTGPQAQQAQAGPEGRAGRKVASLNRSGFASPVVPSSSPAFPPLQSTSSAEISRRAQAPPKAPTPRPGGSTIRLSPSSDIQTGTASPSANPASQGQMLRQPLMTHRQRREVQEHGQLARKPQPRKAHPSEPAPEDRPGGKAPWKAFVPNIPVSACPEYPRDIKDRSKYNGLHMRPFNHLSLYSDEDPGLCYGIFAAFGPRRCPYFDRPNLCRNQHHIDQRVLDWVFVNRGVTRAQLEFLVGMYNCNTPASTRRSLRLPTGQSSKAATPASLEHAHETSGDTPQRYMASKTPGGTPQGNTAFKKSGDTPQGIDDPKGPRKSSGNVPRDAAAPERSPRPWEIASWDLSGYE
jgi:hypothetical protein